MRVPLYFLIPSSSCLDQQHMDQTCLCSTIWWPLLWFRKPSHRWMSGGKKNQPLLMVLLPPCNTTLILWMVSQSCLLPPQSWSGGFYNLHTDNQHEKSAFLHSSSFNHYFSPQTGRPFLKQCGSVLALNLCVSAFLVSAAVCSTFWETDVWWPQY